MAGFTCLFTQGLHGIRHILRLVYIRLAKRRRPRQVLVHVFKNRRELRQGLYARIPVLFVDFFGELVTLEIGMTLQRARPGTRRSARQVVAILEGTVSQAELATRWIGP